MNLNSINNIIVNYILQLYFTIIFYNYIITLCGIEYPLEWFIPPGK
jgi:hypothetical protein